MKTVTVAELEANADLYVEMAQEHEILITENGKVVAKLAAWEE